MEPFLVSAIKLGHSMHTTVQPALPHKRRAPLHPMRPCQRVSDCTILRHYCLHAVCWIVVCPKLNRPELICKARARTHGAIGGESVRLLYEREEQFVLASLAIDVK